MARGDRESRLPQPTDPRARLRHRLDAALGNASTLVVCLVVYALALAAAIAALRLIEPAHPMLAVLAGMVAATLVVFAFATALDNASLYDPFWSVAPPLVMLQLLVAAGEPSARFWLVFALLGAWAARLTWNCFARWPRLDEEDFRYRDLRVQSGRLFPLVNLAGIELFPTLLVFAGCLPLLAVADSDRPLGWLDGVAALVMAGAIALETIADRQLAAHRARGDGSVLTSGLWGLSQHPNYLGELGIWWALFLFGLAAGAPWWTVAGALAMTALFRFVSIPMMLRRKRARRPGYDAAVAGIPVLVPRTLRSSQSA
jgi:steroid 5-alpha reductase family enzyme